MDSEATRVTSPAPATIPHTQSNNLFFALRGAGSSFGIVTEFLYMINERWEYLDRVRAGAPFVP